MSQPQASSALMSLSVRHFCFEDVLSVITMAVVILGALYNHVT